MNPSIRLGRVFGIPIGVNYSWFVILFLIAASLYAWFLRENPAWDVSVRLGVTAVTTVLFFVSLLVHELSHSLVALAQGVPVRGITLFIFGGVSHITREAASARNEFTMAVVGPVSSFILAGTFWGVALLTEDTLPVVSGPARVLAVVNFILGVFNMVPGYPLDGGRVLRAIVWGVTGSMDRATRIAAGVGQLVGYLIIGYGIFLILFGGNFISGIWAIFIGWFLQNAASSSTQQLQLRQALEGYRAKDVMTEECPTVPADVTLEALMNEYMLPQGRRFFIVHDDGRVEGLISLTAVKGVPRESWPATLVGQAMVPTARLRYVRPFDDAFHVLEVMQEADVNQLPVIDDGRLVGVVTRDRVLRLIMVRSELGL